MKLSSRPLQRHLRSLTLVAVVVVFLCTGALLTGQPASFSFSSSSSAIYATPKSSAHIDGLRSLWHDWSPRFHAAHPPLDQLSSSSTATALAAWEVPENTTVRPRPEDLMMLSDEDVQALRAAHSLILAPLRDAIIDRWASDLYAGTGIVITAGGRYSTIALVSVSLLRSTGSTLPIEIFMADETEYNAEICRLLADMNAKCLMLSGFLGGWPGEVKGWSMKPLSMLFSSFRHVLALDADDIPLIPPEELFESAAYQKTGFVDWPDVWMSTESPRFYDIANMTSFPPDLPVLSSESGQIMMDKGRHIRTLLLATYYNLYPKVWYPLQSQGAPGEGDKTTFFSAAVVLGLPYYRVRTTPTIVGRVLDNDEWRGAGMIQYDPEDDSGAAREADENATPREANATADGAMSPRPAFYHGMNIKFDPARMAEPKAIKQDSGEWIRIFAASEQEVVAKFGFDFERKAMGTLIRITALVGSSYPGHTSSERKAELLQMLKEHFKAVYGELDS